LTESCAWCGATHTCVVLNAPANGGLPVCEDTGSLIQRGGSCENGILGLTTPEVVGISAGILAVIIIVPVVVLVLMAIAAKKSYDYYMNRGNKLDGAAQNPMYNDMGRTGENPLHE